MVFMIHYYCLVILFSVNLILSFRFSHVPFRLASKLQQSIGIDLGTTNSLVSVMKDGKPTIIPMSDNNLHPSVVTFLKNGKVMVGKSARTILKTTDDESLRANTFSSVKRLIGRSRVSVEETCLDKSLLNKLHDQVDKRGHVLLSCSHSSKGYVSPEDVSTIIIRSLISKAREYLKANDMDSDITHAVITVPAYFDMMQREATERAGLKAGLQKVKLLTEPEAAALAYGLANNDLKQIIMVIDLGGGTFDVSFLEVGQGIAETIIYNGDGNLGGDDFDTVLYKHMLQEYCRHFNIRHVDNFIKENNGVYTELNRLATQTRIDLSTKLSVDVMIPTIDELKGYTMTITRNKFEELCKDLYERFKKPIRESATLAQIALPGDYGGKLNRKGFALTEEDTIDWHDVRKHLNVESDDEVEKLNQQEWKHMKNKQHGGRRSFKKVREAKIKVKGRYITQDSEKDEGEYAPIHTIHEVVLVGGATRMPGIIKIVQELVGSPPLRTLNPDEAICLGAGVMAGILDGEIEQMAVINPLQAALIRCVALETAKGNTELLKALELESAQGDDSGDLAGEVLSMAKKRKVTQAEIDASLREDEEERRAEHMKGTGKGIVKASSPKSAPKPSKSQLGTLAQLKKITAESFADIDMSPLTKTPRKKRRSLFE